ncbi:MAG: OppA [Actinomycetia bacterium]|nr:OppA [Actinomycetes bacterium]
MPEAPDRVYWDSCVFVAYIGGEPDRARNVADLLEDAAERRIEIITSTATIVEVAYATSEKAGGLDPLIEDNINALWGDSSPVSLVEFHDALAVKARDLIRYSLSEGWSLKPYDAIHLATAQHHGAKALHTYDLTSLKKYAGKVGCAVVEPESEYPRLSID